MVAAPVLGTGSVRSGGSSPLSPTLKITLVGYFLMWARGLGFCIQNP